MYVLFVHYVTFSHRHRPVVTVLVQICLQRQCQPLYLLRRECCGLRWPADHYKRAMKLKEDIEGRIQRTRATSVTWYKHYSPDDSIRINVHFCLASLLICQTRTTARVSRRGLLIRILKRQLLVHQNHPAVSESPVLCLRPGWIRKEDKISLVALSTDSRWWEI